MASITWQRDFAVLKKETFLNVAKLNKLQPMPIELSKQILNENALEKPTQNFFNNLSYYLVCIIDSKASSSLPWPLYDTKTERAYRNDLSKFINDYSSKGLLLPVMSSYLVNPGCYKVTLLMLQMSQLAVQRVLTMVMKSNTHQKELYNTVTHKYKQNDKDFMGKVKDEIEIMTCNYSNYLPKRNLKQKVAEMFRQQITHMEAKLSSLNAQKFIDDLIDGYLKTQTVDEEMKNELMKIKNINSDSKFFDSWLSEVDMSMDKLETEWTEKIPLFLKTCQQTRDSTEALIGRHTGEADKDSYMIEYNPNTNEICTRDLQEQVNSEQKYILKNIVKDKSLNFPNLIRGFLISISFILKNTEIGDEIYKFNEYLDGGKRGYKEVFSNIKNLVERVISAEIKLEPLPVPNDQFLSIKDISEIPPLPDLSDLKTNRNIHSQSLFDTFTPFSISKHQFNLHRKHQVYNNNQPKSLLTVPFHQPLREDFFKNIVSCRGSSYDRTNSSYLQNISIISHPACKPNETIAECSSGFTKQQIMRLLSTKKSSSTKKFKYNTERPAINVKKGGLFNEFNYPNEHNGLYRSHSSPDLFEFKDKKSQSKLTKRKLSIMQEDTPSLLEVSGVALLDKDSSYVTPEAVKKDNFKKPDTVNRPAITITPESENKINKILKDIETDLNKEIEVHTLHATLKVDENCFALDVIEEGYKTVPPKLDTQIERKNCSEKDSIPDFNKKITADTPQTVLKEEKKSLEVIKDDSKAETPKMNTQLIRKTSSLEKIINRFKKVRANVLPDISNENINEIKTIAEEKENFNLEAITANRILLPDLLSPSCSVLSGKSDYLDQLCLDMDEKICKKPRESLGTALGVDHTFLDQFDLID